jgi:hypothetical protein
MRFGTKPVQDWKEPNRFLLKTIANSTLFFFPTEMDLDQIIDSKTVFVGNQQSFGLQTLILQCKIYNQTNIWPRSCLDSFGFKVPIIKHFMEYLGSVELDHLDKVIRSNQPVIVYPGGWREQLKKSSVEKYKLDFEHQKLIELVTLVKENGNRVLPLGAIGIDDMLNIIIDIPMPFETSFPVTIITSYQKQYITIGTEITRWDDQIPYVPLLKSCFETIQESRSRQERDVFRYPMQPFWNVLETVKNRVERRFGGDEMVGSSGKKLSGWLKHKVSTRFNQVLDSGRRVTIEEMEE